MMYEKYKRLMNSNTKIRKKSFYSLLRDTFTFIQ